MTATSDLTAAARSRSFVLTHLDVYDWGAFAGRHCAEIDLRGTAIIGPTGSGKTTLVDALMTLLTANPRYNLASTGGHESDRDLVSYVRGVSGAGNDSGDNEHVARNGAVTSGVSARFCDGEESLRIGALFWIEGTSSAVADLKRRWLFCLGDAPDLDACLQAHRTGGARAVKALESESPGLKVYEDKKSYLARLRSFFGVGENAFNLLNRAAGLKQLNSIDEVFRELVLDDNSRFDRAGEVADEFNTLDGIHAELETAKRQRDSLLPIEREWKDRSQVQQSLDETQRMFELLPRWYAAKACRLFGERSRALNLQCESARNAVTALDEAIRANESTCELLHASYLKTGGAAIEQLEQRCESQAQEVRRRSRPARDYQAWVTAQGWDAALDRRSFDAVQAAATKQVERLKIRSRQERDEAWALGATRERNQQALDQLSATLKEVQESPSSNVPPEFMRFRAALASHLGVDPSTLPFVAELVEVKAEERQRWRGAIERAIGSHRLRLLCEPSLTQAALDWINDRDNRLHVRLHEAHPPTRPVQFYADGFTRKLGFKSHPLREALKQLVADIDRHCVDTAQQVRTTNDAMTDQGLMSGRHGYFDKHDQRPLGSDWMTGFDNRDRLAQLATQVRDAKAALERSRSLELRAQTEAESTDTLVSTLRSLVALEFDDVDLPGARAELDRLQADLERLRAPDSDAARAKENWEAAKRELGRIRTESDAAKSRLTKLAGELGQSNASGARAAARALPPLDESQESAVASRQKPFTADELDRWDDIESDALSACRRSIDGLRERRDDIEKQLIRVMGKAKTFDTGPLSEAGTDMADVFVYLDRLRVLVEEALPERQLAFVSYLNQSSDQGVTQLLSDVENEVARIEERIEDLNRTLERVDFQPGRFLRLQPRRVVHESLRTLDHARRLLRSAALREDEGESHYAALRHMVALLRDAIDKRKTLGARALLDPRHRLQFSVMVIDRVSGNVVETRTSSQGGSGGEKEIIASYVLTASLSYALSPEDARRPQFATIVLDEAFSKSSHAVAGRIIRALAEFGLHPLFVTPNKELRLLRQHTRSAILVHRRAQQATMTSLSWEALEAHARGRMETSREVSE